MGMEYPSLFLFSPCSAYPGETKGSAAIVLCALLMLATLLPPARAISLIQVPSPTPGQACYLVSLLPEGTGQGTAQL